MSLSRAYGLPHGDAAPGTELLECSSVLLLNLPKNQSANSPPDLGIKLRVFQVRGGSDAVYLGLSSDSSSF